MKRLWILLLAMLWSGFALATDNGFVEGKDYRVLRDPVPTNGDKVTVVEFFSYACPHCYHFEPHLEKWLAVNKDKVNFSRVPVVFHPTWKLYAKTYYIADAFKLEDKITSAVFYALHEQDDPIEKPDTMAKLTAQNGLSEDKFMQAYHHSPTIDLLLEQGKTTMASYQVRYIPSIAVGGRYVVDASLVKGNWQHMLDTVDYLIKLSGEQHV